MKLIFGNNYSQKIITSYVLIDFPPKMEDMFFQEKPLDSKLSLNKGLNSSSHELYINQEIDLSV